MPADHHDERVGDKIEAFLEGPPVRAGRPRRTKKPRPEILRAVRKPLPMDPRTDWDAALRHEDARIQRYGRPAAVLVIRLRMTVTGLEDRFAQRIGALIREHARDTDRVTRAAPDRFHVLMPETHEPEATALAERVRAACAHLLPGQPGADLEILAAAATPVRGQSLQDALRQARRAVAD